MSQQITKLEDLLKNRIENMKQEEMAKTKSSTDQTKSKLNAKVGEARGSIHVFNSKDINNSNRNGNEYRGVIRRTWFLGNPQTYASF